MKKEGINFEDIDNDEIARGFASKEFQGMPIQFREVPFVTHTWETFIEKDNGDTLLDIAKSNDIDGIKFQTLPS